MSLYDLIVVGAGPAGLMAAKKAAEAGVNVLLVEKERSLGVKACAEAVSKATLIDAEISPSEKFICNRIQNIYVYPPDEKKHVEIRSSQFEAGEGYILEKPVFLRELANLTAQKDAEIWVNSEVLDVSRESEKNYKVTVKRFGETLTLKAKLIIGCDGINSIIAKKLFNRPNYKLISCLQYRMVNCKLENSNATEFYLGNEIAPKGYVWVFPKSDGIANVGLGVQHGSAKLYLDKFISNHPEKFKTAKTVEVRAAPVPISGQIGEVVNGEAMLCGDAAGQVIPLTGGGIHSSIVAGKITGEVAGKALTSGNLNFEEYPRRYAYYTERIAKSLKALNVIENLPDSDLNQFAEVLSGEDIIDLANGLNIARVSKKLIKHPLFALKMAKALME